MRFVSPLLRRVIYPGLHHAGLLGRMAAFAGCAVVNYHGVTPPGYKSEDAFLDGNLVSPGALRKQLRFLRKHYKIIRPEDFREWVRNGQSLPPRAVLVTCDDGLASNLFDMLPIFQSESIECLFFVTGASCSERSQMLWYEELYLLLRSGQIVATDLQLLLEDAGEPSADLQTIGSSLQEIWWKAVLFASRLNAEARVDKMSILRSKCKSGASILSEPRWRLMNRDELKQLAQAGAILGAHTMSHPVLSECAQQESSREIFESKIILERELGKPVWAFAFPFGNWHTMGTREVDLARQAGFECAFLNVGEGFTGRSNPHTLPRTHITSNMSVAELEAHMTGLHARLQNAVRG